MSVKKFHDGGYVTGTPPQILPVGDHADVFPISDFAKELIEKVAAAMGVSYEQMADEYQRVNVTDTQQHIDLQYKEMMRKFPNTFGYLKSVEHDV